jgi:hypothetical protein
MAYGKGFRRKEGGTAKVLWEEDGLALRYLGQRIAVEEFREMVQAGADEAEGLLDRLMFGGWKEVQGLIEMHRIVDTLMFEGPGRSFATDERNDWLQPGHRLLAERGQPTLWRRGGRGWRMGKVAEYLNRVKAFMGVHLVNIHVWAGQPGRGPEVMTMRHCDTQQVLRNVFVFDGQVLIITDRDKSRAIRGLGRKVARFLPARIGKMMIAYIAWVIPFERMLHDRTKISGLSASLESYLWKDGRKGVWKTVQLSEGLASMTGKEMGVELTVADYRHVAIGFARKIKGMLIRRMEVEMGEQQEEEDGGGDLKTGERREGGKMEYIWVLQATPGSMIARGHYALDVRFPNQLQAEMIANYREISLSGA